MLIIEPSSFPRLSEEHRVEARLRLELEHVPHGDCVRLATLTPCGCYDLDIGILNDRAVHIIRMRRRRVVDALIKIAHANDVTRPGNQLGNVRQKLSPRSFATGEIEEV